MKFKAMELKTCAKIYQEAAKIRMDVHIGREAKIVTLKIEKMIGV